MTSDERPGARSTPAWPSTGSDRDEDEGGPLDSAGIPEWEPVRRAGPWAPQGPRSDGPELSPWERPATGGFERAFLERPLQERPAPALRVMLVDDHALVRSAVSQAISAPDVELVAEAATAEDAFALALAVRPDIMLLDIDLPGMNGLQMLEELSPRLPDTKIVMLTVSDSERDMLEALARGAAGYLTKDLSPEALLRALRGTGRGELAMSRRFSARAMRHFVDAARRGRTATGGIVAGLSPRENDVLRMLADGLTDKEIATALIISPRTVETHVSNILHKLDVRKRSEAAQRYRESL